MLRLFFGQVLGQLWGSKSAKKWALTRSLRLSGVWPSPKREINERGEKGEAVGNILSEEEGGIKTAMY